MEANIDAVTLLRLSSVAAILFFADEFSTLLKLFNNESAEFTAFFTPFITGSTLPITFDNNPALTSVPMLSLFFKKALEFPNIISILGVPNGFVFIIAKEFEGI